MRSRSTNDKVRDGRIKRRELLGRAPYAVDSQKDPFAARGATVRMGLRIQAAAKHASTPSEASHQRPTARNSRPASRRSASCTRHCATLIRLNSTIRNGKTSKLRYSSSSSSTTAAARASEMSASLASPMCAARMIPSLSTVNKAGTSSSDLSVP